ncbi:amino acid adenylation domain-containing protein [Microbulbifer sp. SAOS-129_SWC]|uniref:amino acid adenylation domain-containing protein n=1 Tax=Microbulbifer sp. SAOS-129_SWC TaxID=3145235 RepID=UPI003216B6EF
MSSAVAEVRIKSSHTNNNTTRSIKDLEKSDSNTASYPSDKTIQEVFEKQVKLTPDHIAVVFDGRSLTYAQLNGIANNLAKSIREKLQKESVLGSSSNSLVALYFKPGLEMVTSILAVLKAGAGYVPLSIDSPDDRIVAILEDSRAKIILTTSEFKQQIRCCSEKLTSPGSVTCVGWDDISTDRQSENLPVINDCHDLAYIIFTSGTTGKPKGVMVNHQSVLAFAFDEKYVVRKTVNRVASLSNYSFDAFVFDFFFSLLNGKSVYLLDRETMLSLDELKQFIVSNEIDTFFSTTSFFNALISSETLIGTSVKNLIFGGEKANEYYSNKAVADLPDTEIYNVYGPTETVVFASSFRLKQGLEFVPIGKPIGSKSFYVLDEHQNRLAAGEIGELYVGGAGLAIGYLNRPELTTEKFLPNPFASEEDRAKGHETFYKTGDLVRWLADGNLEFIGRSDTQIKLNGYRIELEEIELALLSQPTVKQAVVTLYEQDNTKALVAYVVPEAETELNLSALRAALSNRLPGYMVPVSINSIERIPLTPNGKTDRRALPQPEFSRAQLYVAPRNSLERQLCALWEQTLGLDRVGIEDNFFHLGGNSISAIRLSAACQRELGNAIPLHLLFEGKTIAAVVKAMDQHQFATIPKLNLTSYPLSSSQESLFFIHNLADSKDAYHIPVIRQLRADIDLERLRQALQYLVKQHPILRTIYRKDTTGAMYQVVLEEGPAITISELPDDSDLEGVLAEAQRAPFDLEVEPGFRASIYQGGEASCLFLLWHHIAFDGWSLDLFLEALTATYDALSNHTSLPETPNLGYGDYAHWQRQQLSEGAFAAHQEFWKKQLQAVEPLALPLDFPRPKAFDYQGGRHHFVLDQATSDGVRTLAKAHETTVYTVLLSAFFITVSRLSAQNDIVIGTPSDGRYQGQTQALLGYFVNSLPLRMQMSGDASVDNIINETRKVIADAKAHEALPFEKMVDGLAMERDLSRHPVFQVMFGVQSFGRGAEVDRLFSSTLTAAAQAAQFDVSLFLDDAEARISGELLYASSLFSADTARQMAEYYQRIVQGCVEDSSQAMGTLELLSPAQRQQVLYDWNNLHANYPTDTTLYQLFEAQAARTPEQVALVYNGETLTYRELNLRANQLAHLIRQRYQDKHQSTLAPDTLIALYLERGLGMVVGILGVLKAGAAYVPISPEYPVQRVDYILEDTRAEMVLCSSRYTGQMQARLDAVSAEASLLDIDSLGDIAELLDGNPVPLSGSQDLAYVIYTSGTTGTPKGVMIEHRGAINLVYAQYEVFGIKSYKHTAIFSSYVFDAFVFELFASIASGSTIHVCSEEQRKNQSKLSALIKKEGLELITLPPIVAELLDADAIRTLKQVILAGESPSLEIMESFAQSVTTYNAYGPTEITVCATAKRFSGGVSASNIGSILPNINAYILDESRNPVPVGTPGELYLGGAGVARGYLNLAVHTEERFMPNPFVENSSTSDRLYKTGDLARRMASGDIEFLGRVDTQVKIRGFRIELKEIEAHIKKVIGVSQCAVIDFSHHGHKRLAAYVVAEAGTDLTQEYIISKLSESLPDYMIPAVISFQHEIPRTINGKLDRDKLPEPTFHNSEKKVPPANKTQSSLLNIWKSTLGIDELGVTDSFFHSGGDSILAMQLTSKMKAAGFNIGVNDVFENPTVEKISELLSGGQDGGQVQGEQGILEGSFDLSPIQEWFFDQDYPKVSHWNQAFMIPVSSGYDPEDIILALERLSEQHDMLRCSFSGSNHKIVQNYNERVVVSYEKRDVRNISKSDLLSIIDAQQSSLCIYEPPLWKAVHFVNYDDQGDRLLFIMHHLIFDAVSIRIVAEDCYRLLEKQDLGTKTSSFRQWQSTITNYCHKNSEQYSHWENVLSRQVNIDAQSDELEEIGISLGEEDSSALIDCARNRYNTNVGNLLLYSLSMAASVVFDIHKTPILLESHGRAMIDPLVDVSRTIGWFTSIYPAVIENHDDLDKGIMLLKEGVKSVPDLGVSFGFYYQNSELGKYSLPKIRFNYLGKIDYSGNDSEAIDIQVEGTGTSIATENTDDNLIGLDCYLSDEGLHLNFQSRLPGKQSLEFQNEFISAVRSIIDNCKESPDKVVHTLSDLSDFDAEVFLDIGDKETDEVLLMFPPGNGGAESYLNNIGDALKPRRMILFDNIYYRLACHYGTSYVKQITYEELVDQYFIWVKKIRPAGPYHLFGWCFGGILAFEVAKKLIANGDRVGSITLIDSYFDYKSAKDSLVKDFPMIKDNDSNQINYQYVCEKGGFSEDTNVTLFKAGCTMTDKELSVLSGIEEAALKELVLLDEFYVSSKDNLLGGYLSEEHFQVVPLESSHAGWIDSCSDMGKILAHLRKVFSTTPE